MVPAPGVAHQDRVVHSYLLQMQQTGPQEKMLMGARARLVDGRAGAHMFGLPEALVAVRTFVFILQECRKKQIYMLVLES
jgi:hypothetical protein